MTTFVNRNRFTVSASVIVVALAAAVLLARSPASSAALSDGDHDVRIVSHTSDGTVTVDPVEVLSGEAAVDAAVADGFIEPGDDLPNDVYVREGSTATVSLSVAAIVDIEIYDCTSECTHVSVDRATFLAGDARPLNGELAVFDATITNGQIVSLAEIYLP